MTAPNPELDAFMAENPQYATRECARATMNRRKRAGTFKMVRHTEQLDASGNLLKEYVTSVPERAQHKPLDGAVLSRRSALVDAEGNIIQQWLIEKPEDRAKQEQWGAIAAELLAPIARAPWIEAPLSVNYDLLTAYPIGDHHLGMLSWKHETGDSYDIDIGENLLMGAVDDLVARSPASYTGLVVILGDYMHYDGFEAVTPTNRNLLDADGRYPKMVSAGLRLARRMIDRAAAKHEIVRVIVEIGNHDPSCAIFLMIALANIYENNPRVVIDTSPKHFHYYEHGLCLIGTHHGHGRAAKAEQLPLIMAADQPEAWGRTKYRYWWTGHVHHQSVKDFAGVSVESFRILPPGDAYAANEGYRAPRDMKAIVLHKQHGEVARMIVNPSMLKGRST